jgi:hypothetical protein
MFWQKKPKIDWLHLIFWAAVFIAVMSAVALVVLYTASMLAGDWKVSVGSKDGNKTLSVEATLPGAAAVSANYFREISTLVEYVSSTTDVEMSVRETVQNKLSEIRVPREKRDDHLKVYLQLAEESKTKEIDRVGLQNLLSDLIK